MRKEKALRIALVGLGLQGERLASAIRATDGVVLAAAIGENQEHAAEFAAKHGVPAMTLREALSGNQIDAVAIASPNHRHAKEALAAAAAGKHLLIEKPMTVTLADARKVLAAAKRRGVRVFVDFQLRMHPSVEAAREKVKRGDIGKLLYAELQWSIGGLAGKPPPLPRHMRWRENPKESGGGALPTRGSHLFDLLRYLTGKDAESVLAWSDATKTKVDRSALGLVVLAGGIPAYVMTSKALPDADNRVVLHGEKGKMELRDIFAHAPAPLYEATIASFRDACHGKKTVLASGTDGLASLALTEAFQKSTKTGKAALVGSTTR